MHHCKSLLSWPSSSNPTATGIAIVRVRGGLRATRTLLPVAPTRSRHAAAERWIWQSRPLRTKWQDWIAHLMIMANSFSWVPWIEPAYNFRDSAPLLISLYSSSGRCPPRHIHNTCELMSSPNGVVSEYAPVLSSVERFGLVASCTDQTQKASQIAEVHLADTFFKTKEGSGTANLS